MEDNPYMMLIKRLKDEMLSMIPTTYRLGRVSSISPLRIEVETLELEKDTFLKCDNILSFNIGEELLLIPIEEEQRYIIVGKVVDA